MNGLMPGDNGGVGGALRSAIPGVSGPWSSPLFGCFDDIGICLIAWFVPCVTIGQNAEGAGVSDCLIGGLLSLVPLVNIFCLFKIRGAIREKYNLEGSPVMDLVMILCCPLCTISQEARELKSHGVSAAQPQMPRV
ncbi:uncharacterized protein LOC134818632 [Bolinopsis microptera]|uniref:uncharacterized protein LOC134818632 n=1 Tax=Bolinopsis microptera TaxID=2820187 RepID=UPI00307987FA